MEEIMDTFGYLSLPVQAGILLFLFVLGCCIFSFLNVVVYRVPRKLNFVKGRSFCPGCGHSLGAGDLVPVLSWTLLKGKCRYCGAPIALRYTLVELFGGVGALVCFLRYGFDLRTVIAFVFLALCTVIALVDWDTMEIPNGFVAAVAVLAVISVFGFSEITLVERAIGAVCISLPLLLLTLAIPGAFGGGDIKLTVATGLLLGWKLSLMGFFLAVLSGGIYGIVLLATRKKGKKDHFAFGPFLCAGMMASLLWGGWLLDWYLGLLGLV